MRLSEKEVYKVIRHTRSGPTSIRLEESYGERQLWRPQVRLAQIHVSKARCLLHSFVCVMVPAPTMRRV